MDEMRPPLYALLISPDREARRAILEERKQITIREGLRDYRSDRPVMICCPEDGWCVTADIAEVRHCSLAEVTPEEFEADGYRTPQEMLDDLRQFYPHLDWSSPVTVIRWASVRGKLVDDWRNRAPVRKLIDGWIERSQG